MIALDLFAGHGWGVACQKLGIEEYGVEIMPEAVATREANGMRTIYRDVWEGLGIGATLVNGTGANAARRSTDAPAPTIHFGQRLNSVSWERPEVPDYDLLIASPPCQTFSMAGGGAGRKALDDVLEAIRERAYLDPAALREFGEKHDPRTALVLTPLAHVARDAPMYVVFEQVPPVLPVWEACAEEMRRWGYSVWTGNLQAEMYGVPQTRKRAVLIARADGIEAAPPTPTHSRYYPRDPKKLDPGVLPWVSMAEALGWTPGEKVAHTRRSKTFTDGGRPDRADDTPAPTVTGHDGHPRGGFEWHEGAGSRIRTNQGNPRDGYYEREDAAPLPTVTGIGSRSWNRIHDEPGATQARLGQDAARERYADRKGTNAERITVAEAAALQSYPAGFEFSGTKTKQFLQVGNAVPPLLAEAILKGFLS